MRTSNPLLFLVFHAPYSVNEICRKCDISPILATSWTTGVLFQAVPMIVVSEIFYKTSLIVHQISCLMRIRGFSTLANWPNSESKSLVPYSSVIRYT